MLYSLIEHSFDIYLYSNRGKETQAEKKKNHMVIPEFEPRTTTTTRLSKRYALDRSATQTHCFKWRWYCAVMFLS